MKKIIVFDMGGMKVTPVETVFDLHDREHDFLTKQKAVVEYCYDHLDKMWAAKITGIVLGCDFKDAKEHADQFFKHCEEEIYD